jgi:histone deacetylase 11
MVPLIYSPDYNITAFGLERLHPFDSVKYARIHDWLIRQGVRHTADFVRPKPCTPEDLQRVHSADYLEKLHHRSELARIFEVGIVGYLPSGFVDWRVLGPMRLATGGTILACRLAREQGLAINLGGGYHHASRGEGHGFCAYADTPIAIARLHAEKPFRSVLIVDTDAHQGDGTADTIRTWPWAHALDFFEDALFPFPKVEEAYPVPLASGMGGVEYLDILHTELGKALDRFTPEFVVYNAGSDVLATDPLTSLQLTVEEMVERDLYVVTQLRERNIPVAMVLSGGYGPQSWHAHARSIEALATRFDQISLPISEESPLAAPQSIGLVPIPG